MKQKPKKLYKYERICIRCKKPYPTDYPKSLVCIDCDRKKYNGLPKEKKKAREMADKMKTSPQNVSNQARVGFK